MDTSENDLRKAYAMLRSHPFPGDSDDERASLLHAELADFDGCVAGHIETLLGGGRVRTAGLEPDQDLQLRLVALANEGELGAEDAQCYLAYLEELHGALAVARALARAG